MAFSLQYIALGTSEDCPGNTVCIVRIQHELTSFYTGCQSTAILLLYPGLGLAEMFLNSQH